MAKRIQKMFRDSLQSNGQIRGLKFSMEEKIVVKNYSRMVASFAFSSRAFNYDYRGKNLVKMYLMKSVMSKVFIGKLTRFIDSSYKIQSTYLVRYRRYKRKLHVLTRMWLGMT